MDAPQWIGSAADLKVQAARHSVEHFQSKQVSAGLFRL
jgi:hypothetical protein